MKWIVCLLALLAVSCGVAEVIEPEGSPTGSTGTSGDDSSDGKYPVEISLGETTRLSIDGQAWTDGDYIGVSVDGVEGKAIYRYNGTTGEWQNNVSATGFTRLYWPDEKNHTVTAWYPYNDGTFTIIQNKVMRGTGQGNYKSPAVIQMEHQLAYVRVTLNDPAYGVNSDVARQTYNATISRGVVTSSALTGGWWGFYGDDNVKVSSYLPGSPPPDGFNIGVYNSANTYVTTLSYTPAIRTLEAGKVYDFNISLPHYAVGDLYPKTGTPIGVVSLISNEGFRGYIVSLDEITTTFGPQGVQVHPEGENWNQGVQNMGHVQRLDPDFSDYPAFRWVDAKNPRGVDYVSNAYAKNVWFLPGGVDVTDHLFPNLAAVNAGLARAGGTPLTAGAVYGSATSWNSNALYSYRSDTSPADIMTLKTTPVRYRAMMIF